MSGIPAPSTAPVRIEAKRLYLRPLSESDCGERYVTWLKDPVVGRFLETRHAEQTLDGVKAFVAGVNARSDEHLFGIFLKPNNLHIGNIKVGPVGRHHPVADVSLLIGDRECWGRGYAAEAIEAVSRYAFAVLGLRKLSASMYVDNQGSYRAFLKVGFKDEGRRRAHYIMDGRMCDVLVTGLIPEDLT
jgi:RimJ/RimL family protein N-acetyltransferase